jgi:nitroreductase
MESISDLLAKRRSTRKFTDEKLTQDQVVTLMKAALMSPSSKRSNPWQFVMVDDAELLQALAGCKEQSAAFIADAALAVVVLADPLTSDVWVEDAAIASIILQLQAEDLGLGSCWVQVRERQTADGQPAEEYIRGLLNVPLPWQVLSVVAIGHKAAERKPFNEEHLQWEKVHINRFGEKQQ